MAPFSGAEPAQLAVAGSYVPPESTHVSEDFLQGRTDHQGSQRLHCGYADFVPATDREGQPMACKSLRRIRLEDHVCRRIVRSGIHRVGTVERTRGWKTNIVNRQISDFS